MDNLARDAMLANRSGVSYGRWKAENPSTAPEKVDEIPQGWKICEHCGKPFKERFGKRFCDIECRTQASREKDLAIKREYYRKWKLNKKMEAAK